MTLYIIDIGPLQKVSIPNWLNDNELNNFYTLSEQILLHNDIIRGYTVVKTTINIYLNQLNKTIGRYVDIILKSYEIPDDLEREQYGETALNFHNNDDAFKFGATLPEISVVSLDNGGYIAYTESMLEYSYEDYYNYEFLFDYLVILFDDTFKYITPMNDPAIVELKQFILDGILYIKKDIFNDEGPYKTDPYYLLKMYYTFLLYTDYDIRKYVRIV